MSDCKLYYLYFCGFDAFSPWSLVYISVEKYIAITNPSRRYLLKKKKSQIIYIVVLFVSNVLYRWFYLPFSVDLIPTIKSDNSTTVSCYYLNMEWSDLVNFTDAANCVVVPFFLMSFFSVLLIRSIFLSRRRVQSNYSKRDRARNSRDIKFAISLLIMNLMFVLLNLPIQVLLAAPVSASDLYLFIVYVFYTSYTVNFYITLFTNSLVYREFFANKRLSNQNRTQSTRN
jgi:hypothetical protein